MTHLGLPAATSKRDGWGGHLHQRACRTVIGVLAGLHHVPSMLTLLTSNTAEILGFVLSSAFQYI
jgi:hypothetical protein